MYDLGYVRYRLHISQPIGDGLILVVKSLSLRVIWTEEN